MSTSASVVSASAASAPDLAASLLVLGGLGVGVGAGEDGFEAVMVGFNVELEEFGGTAKNGAGISIFCFLVGLRKYKIGRKRGI